MLPHSYQRCSHRHPASLEVRGRQDRWHPRLHQVPGLPTDLDGGEQSVHQPHQDLDDVNLHLLSSSAPSPAIQVVQSTRLLGITLDDKFNWKQHVTDTIRSASYKIYMLQRLKSLGTPADKLKEVYTSFILPKLMYASPVWSPSLNITHHHQLEKIKKRALRIIPGPASHDYESALNMLNLPRLSVKHEEALMKFGEGLLKHSISQITPP